MDKKDFLALVERIRNGQASDKDISLYNTWFAKFQTSDVWDIAEQGELKDIEKEIRNRIHQQINNRSYNFKNIKPILRFSIAAVILVALMTGLYTIYYKPVPAEQTTKNNSHSIISGYNKATLTLSDGRQLILNEANSGSIALQGNADIENTQDGRIIYKNLTTTKELGDNTIAYNVLTTPNGGQYRINFADGSHAFLNAASSLRYPTNFGGKERVVELNGEAYFEIAHNPAKPFRVISKGQIVEVLGTNFNISSYKDETPVKTTLIAGSVRVSTGGHTTVLKPGQQLTVGVKGISVTETDVEEAVAWKNGYLEFDDKDIQSVMREISRWFDVKIDFEGPANDTRYTARISKYADLKEVLKVLESTKTVHFKIQGRRIMVKQ